MVRKLDDDEVMDYSFNKMMDDLDGIRSAGMFSPENEGGMSGIAIEIKPITAEAPMDKPLEGLETPEEEENEDRLRGISDISPLMSQLHGKR